MKNEVPEYVKNWKTGLRDMKILDLLETTDVKNIGSKMDPRQTENATYQNLRAIRERILRYKWYINNLNNRQRRSRRVRKFTTSPEKLEEEEGLI